MPEMENTRKKKSIFGWFDSFSDYWEALKERMRRQLEELRRRWGDQGLLQPGKAVVREDKKNLDEKFPDKTLPYDKPVFCGNDNSFKFNLQLFGGAVPHAAASGDIRDDFRMAGGLVTKRALEFIAGVGLGVGVSSLFRAAAVATCATLGITAAPAWAIALGVGAATGAVMGAVREAWRIRGQAKADRPTGWSYAGKLTKAAFGGIVAGGAGGFLGLELFQFISPMAPGFSGTALGRSMNGMIVGAADGTILGGFYGTVEGIKAKRNGGKFWRTFGKRAGQGALAGLLGGLAGSTIRNAIDVPMQTGTITAHQSMDPVDSKLFVQGAETSANEAIANNVQPTNTQPTGYTSSYTDTYCYDTDSSSSTTPEVASTPVSTEPVSTTPAQTTVVQHVVSQPTSVQPIVHQVAPSHPATVVVAHVVQPTTVVVAHVVDTPTHHNDGHSHSHSHSDGQHHHNNCDKPPVSPPPPPPPVCNDPCPPPPPVCNDPCPPPPPVCNDPCPPPPPVCNDPCPPPPPVCNDPCPPPPPVCNDPCPPPPPVCNDPCPPPPPVCNDPCPPPPPVCNDPCPPPPPVCDNPPPINENECPDQSQPQTTEVPDTIRGREWHNGELARADGVQPSTTVAEAANAPVDQKCDIPPVKECSVPPTQDSVVAEMPTRPADPVAEFAQVKLAA